MAAKLASLCNDERNDSKASRGITTNTSFGDVTLIWSGDLSKARERNGLHPVMAIAAEGLSDNKELEKKNDELFKTVKTLETRLSTTGMAIGFESLEVMQMVLGSLRELWHVNPQGDVEKWFIVFMLEKMKAGGIKGPGKDDGWIVFNNNSKIEISANGMSAMGGTKWGAKGEFISTEVLTVNMEAFISPTKGVHSIKSGFREGAPGFEAVQLERWSAHLLRDGRASS
jgi:hypothetical protein